jgi:hypothetical protein
MLLSGSLFAIAASDAERLCFVCDYVKKNSFGSGRAASSKCKQKSYSKPVEHGKGLLEHS